MAPLDPALDLRGIGVHQHQAGDLLAVTLDEEARDLRRQGVAHQHDPPFQFKRREQRGELVCLLRRIVRLGACAEAVAAAVVDQSWREGCDLRLHVVPFLEARAQPGKDHHGWARLISTPQAIADARTTQVGERLGRLNVELIADLQHSLDASRDEEDGRPHQNQTQNRAAPPLR